MTPSVGRFINADDTTFILVTKKANQHNLFTYCVNNPITNSDPMGLEGLSIALIAKIAAVIKTMVIAIALILLLQLLLEFIRTPEFQRCWQGFCTAIGNSFLSGWQTLKNNFLRAWLRAKNALQVFTKTLSYAVTVARATSKIIAATRNIRNSASSFFEISYYGNLPVIGKRINRFQAIQKAKKGLNSITYFRTNALYVANVAGNGKALHHGPHGGAGYFSHYHIFKHKNSAHIAYIV